MSESPSNTAVLDRPAPVLQAVPEHDVPEAQIDLNVPGVDAGGTEVDAPAPDNFDAVLEQTIPKPEHDVADSEGNVGKKTAALVLGMEAVGVAVDAGLKIGSAYVPFLEGLAARE